jgi:hypothetical protein
MASDKTRAPRAKRLTGDAAFQELTKQIAERNEQAFKAARKLRDVADKKMFAERRKRDRT